MKYFPSLPLFLLLYSHELFASFPYMAIQVEENLSFVSETCPQAVKRILKEIGFQKIQEHENHPTLFATLQKNTHYEYRTVVKCLPAYHLVVIVMVTPMPNKALAKLEEFTRHLKKYAHEPMNKNHTLMEYIHGLSPSERKLLLDYLNNLENMEKMMPFP